MGNSIYDRTTPDVASEDSRRRMADSQEKREDKRRRDAYYKANFPDSPLNKKPKEK